VTGEAQGQALAKRVAHSVAMRRAGVRHITDVKDVETAQVCTDSVRGIEMYLACLDAPRVPCGRGEVTPYQGVPGGRARA